MSKTTIKIGDIVFVKDVNSLRGKWRIGRVMKTHPSKDNAIRSLTIVCKAFSEEENVKNTTKMVELERAVHNLVVLIPVDEGETSDEDE